MVVTKWAQQPVHCSACDSVQPVHHTFPESRIEYDSIIADKINASVNTDKQSWVKSVMMVCSLVIYLLNFVGALLFICCLLKMKSVIKYFKTRWRMSDKETEYYFPFETENLETY